MASKATIRLAEYAAEDRRESAAGEDNQHAMLIRQAEAGDASAFEKLASRYDEPVLRLLLMLTASEQEALDLCRATFLAAYRGLARRKTESLYIWLYRLAATQWLHYSQGNPPAPNELSAREKLVFALKTGQHMGLRTVAEILETPEPAAARAFSRAVCKLRISHP